MTWDMVLVTVTLVTVLLLIILLALVSRIWQDRTPRSKKDDAKDSHAPASQSVELDKVTGRENSLA